MQAGFTLIEMLIVVMIMGILAGVVTLSVTTFRGDAAASCTATNQKLVSIATAAYEAKHPASNPTTGDLVTSGYLETAPGTC